MLETRLCGRQSVGPPPLTEILLFGPDNFSSAGDQFIGPFHSKAKNPDLIFDLSMTFDQHVTKLVQSLFFFS